MTTATQDDARVAELENELRLVREQYSAALTSIRDQLLSSENSKALIRLNAWLSGAEPIALGPSIS